MYNLMLTSSERQPLIDNIQALPKDLETAVKGLDDSQLDTHYREGGWTVRQVVHHLADSHMNAFVRMKLILTETDPAFKTYDQDTWATMPDSQLPIQNSLDIVRGLHERMTTLFKNVKEEDWQRTGDHPDNGKMKLEDLLRIYGGHGHRHVKQITDLKERKGW